jgi:hypothetical protein
VAGDINTTGTLRVNGTDMLATYATTESLSSYATTASLSSYATTASLSSYATTSSLGSYATLDGTPNFNKCKIATGRYTFDASYAFTQGAYISWNESDDGFTTFINQRGYGNGGFRFYDINGDTLRINNKTAIFVINSGGAVTATSYNASSDYRIKENIKPITTSIDVLNPVCYYNKKTEKDDMGFIAHEVQEHFPFLVTGEKDGKEMQSINYSGFIALLTKEIQDLKKEKIQQTQEIENLKSRLNNIESLLTELLSKK